VLQPRVSVIIPTLNEARNLPRVLAAATSDIIVMIGAGGSTGPAGIPAFAAALTGGGRLREGVEVRPRGRQRGHRPAAPLGDKALGAVATVVYRTRYAGLCCGCDAFRASAVPAFGLQPEGDAGVRGDGFAIETILSLRASAAGLAVTGVPSFEHARIRGESNLNTFRDGRRVLKTILTEWRNR
jgi:hypothetical protein